MSLRSQSSGKGSSVSRNCVSSSPRTSQENFRPSPPCDEEHGGRQMSVCPPGLSPLTLCSGGSDKSSGTGLLSLHHHLCLCPAFGRTSNTNDGKLKDGSRAERNHVPADVETCLSVGKHTGQMTHLVGVFEVEPRWRFYLCINKRRAAFISASIRIWTDVAVLTYFCRLAPHLQRLC